MNDEPVSKWISKWKNQLWNIHLDDMKPGIHDHILFGEGDVDYYDLFNALKAIKYLGAATVELSRHSHDAVATARRAFEFLAPFTTISATN